MSSELHYRFDDFHLDVANRQLRRNGEPVDLNARYFDALVLLVQEHGRLVEKGRLFSDVWDDVVVSDAALTQCIKAIRKQLGDEAANPRYIKTVPRHGYRFIGPVEVNHSGEFVKDGGQDTVTGFSIAASEEDNELLHKVVIDALGGILGGIAAGIAGGLLYGFGIAAAATDPAMGITSMLLVLISLCAIIAGMGGLGVSLGTTVANITTGGNKRWTILGAGLGGLLVGGLAKLLGVDAFNLLFGKAPEGITGGLEGAVLGAAVILGAIFGGGLNATRRLRPVLTAAFTGGAAGVLISIADGRLMTGSLALLTHSFAQSQLRIDALGQYFGETGFGFITQMVLTGVEGFLFGACVIAGIVYMRFLGSKN